MLASTCLYALYAWLIICIQSICFKSSSIWRRMRSTSSAAEELQRSATDDAALVVSGRRWPAAAAVVVIAENDCPTVACVRHHLRSLASPAARRRPFDFRIDFGAGLQTPGSIDQKKKRRRKGKEEYLYSAILVRTHTLKALRHGSP